MVTERGGGNMKYPQYMSSLHSEMPWN